MVQIMRQALALMGVAAVTAAAPASFLIPRENSLDDFMVQSLPGLMENVAEEDRPVMYAGRLDIGKGTKYFYWKVEDNDNRLPENHNRTMFWFNGGPGCSLFDGALMENGPFRINEDEKVTYNNGSWHRLMDMVYVDQPAGTGFSDVDGQEYLKLLYDVGLNYIKFLDSYYELFHDEAEYDIYLGGESYAGQYIPYIARAILDRNNANREGERKYNIKGITIGNGWISPNEQLLWYLPFYIQAGLISTQSQGYSTLLSHHERCQKVVDENDGAYDRGTPVLQMEHRDCNTILSNLMYYSRDNDAPANEVCINIYDYTLRDSYKLCGMNWPFDLKYVYPFLRNEEVRNALHVPDGAQWKECKTLHGFSEDRTAPSIYLFPDLLKELEIVLFNGNLDIICNYLGQEAMIEKLKWGGEKGLGETKRDWLHDESPVGYVKLARNLSLVIIFNASHMVPYDRPEISRAIIDLLVHNFDETDEKIATRPIGQRKALADANKEPLLKEEVSTSGASEGASKTSTGSSEETNPSKATDEAPSVSASENPKGDDNGLGLVSKVTRLIQVFVIAVLMWGVFVLVMLYRSRPVLIIRLGSPSTKKKNVQWADQLRQFQDDELEFDQQLGTSTDAPQQGFIAKTIGKITGNAEGRQYVSVPDSEDLELGDLGEPSVDDFIIDDDEGDEGDDNERDHTPARSST